MVLCFPVLSHPSARPLEVRCNVHVLLLPRNISLNSPSCMTPLFYHRLLLLISPLVGQLLILTIDPELLKLLLEYLTGRLVRQITRLAFKSVLLVISCWFSRREESPEWIGFH